MSALSPTYSSLAYLVGSICFIFGLKCLSSPKTARSGNAIAAMGMVIALIGTLILPDITNKKWIFLAFILGAIPGLWLARSVKMTAMPQMVSLFNGMGGACALFLSTSEFLKTLAPLGMTSSLVHRISVLLGAVFGAISFTGSLIAYGKLQGIIAEKQTRLPFQTFLHLAFILCAIFSVYLLLTGTSGWPFFVLIGIALVLGITQCLSIGGADMPVVISVLNSCTGMAAAITGLAMQNMSMIIAGTLVGAAGSLLTLLMCRAMNRSLRNVLFGQFGVVGVGAQKSASQGIAHEINASEASILMAYGKKVIIIPGYGLAVAQAQHLVQELAVLLEKKYVDVKYAIHPVAGRMPGHMNVLLAEANVPYQKLFDMDEINPEFPQADVALVIGANDVVNPAARTDASSPIYGMPILDADKAAHILVIKRGQGVGFSGIENGLFFNPKTRMLYGDAKKVLKDLITETKAL